MSESFMCFFATLSCPIKINFIRYKFATASRASLKPKRRFRMFSPSSYVSLDFQANEGLLVRRGEAWDGHLTELWKIDPMEIARKHDSLAKGLLDIVQLELNDQERPLQAELSSFLKAVREGTEPEVSGLDGRRALELADRTKGAIEEQVW